MVGCKAWAVVFSQFWNQNQSHSRRSCHFCHGIRYNTRGTPYVAEHRVNSSFYWWPASDKSLIKGTRRHMRLSVLDPCWGYLVKSFEGVGGCLISCVPLWAFPWLKLPVDRSLVQKMNPLFGNHRAHASPDCRMSLSASAEPPLCVMSSKAIFGCSPSIFDRKPRSKVEIPLLRDCENDWILHFPSSHSDRRTND